MMKQQFLLNGGMSVLPPANIIFPQVTLFPVVRFQVFIAVGNRKLFSKELPATAVQHILNNTEPPLSTTNTAGVIPLTEIARYALKHFKKKGITVVAVGRLVTYEYHDEEKGINFVSRAPKLCTTAWLTKQPEPFLTLEMAKKTKVGAKTAYERATVKGRGPQRVVRAVTGSYYPCAETDICIIPDQLKKQ